MVDPLSLVKYFRENLTPHAIQTFLCYVFGLFCLLPLYYESHQGLEESMLRSSLTSIGYRYSSVATLALVIPFTLDLLTDLVFKPKNGKQSNEKTLGKEGFLNNTEKLLFLIGIVILPIVAFFPEDIPNWAFIYICCNKCQQILIYGAIIISLSRYDNSAWTDKSTYMMIILLGTGNVFLCNVSNRRPFIVSSTYEGFELTALLLVLLSIFIYIFSTIRWLRAQYKKRYLIKSMNQKTFELFYPLYSTMTVLCIIILAVLVFVYKRLARFDEVAILLNNLIYFSYILFIIFLSMRMVKSEVVQGLYALIESKKVYVRYISHELRTPLNAGLKLLTDDIQASMDPKDADRNDILSDANSACRTALDILNDLLCFDKLENGVLVLHKQEEPVLPFISDCVSMFSSQARECGVNLSIISPDLRNYTDSALKATDIAVMDKFKMDQVLRNLISNALKFTPRGGTVTVCAAFVPNEKQVPVPLRRHSEEDYMSYRSMKVYAVAEKQPDIEAAVPNSQELSSRSIKSYKSLKSKTKNNTINGKLVIVISDSGVGLSRVNLKRLFKEVVQFNPEILQAGGGSGLGLWITNMIVAMHDGKICANSGGEGMGCSFTVEIDMHRKVASPPIDNSLYQAASHSSIHFHSSAEHNGILLREENNTIEDNLLRQIANVESKDDANGSEALNQSINLVSVYSKQLENKGGSFSSAKIGKKVSISIIGSTIIEDLSSYSSRLANSRRQSLFTKQKLDILIVDDSGLSRKMLSRLLTTSGCVCDIAEDGLLALDKVKAKMSLITNGSEKGSFDVILMDFVMPNMDGPTATKAIRDRGYTAPIFGLTGNALDSDITYFMSCGANEVMTKPFDLPHFQELMKNIN